MKNQRTVLITGASRGIGAATAQAFGAAGWNVAVNYAVHRTEAENVADKIRHGGGTAEIFQADIASPEQVESMVSGVLTKFGKVDTLVCNAGISLIRMLCDTTEEDWNRIFAVNAGGAYRCIRAVLPGMVHRKYGRIITVSSMWGERGGSCEAAYSASKAAVIGLTKALAKELGPSGITVNCVAPGVIDTEMNQELDGQTREELRTDTPVQRLGTADDVARAILFFADDAASFLNGQILGVDGGIIS